MEDLKQGCWNFPDVGGKIYSGEGAKDKNFKENPYFLTIIVKI